MELVKDANEIEVEKPVLVEDIQKKILEALPDITGQPSPTDPVINEDDKKLLDKARRTVGSLQVEIKTVIGFTSDYLTEKYGIKTQEQFDRLFGNF